MLQYTYPDGSTSSVRPRDGQMFYVHTGGSVTGSFMWDDLLGLWVDTSAGAVPGHPYAPSVSGIDWSGAIYDPPLKCECGKEKHKFANHSSWCDLA